MYKNTCMMVSASYKYARFQNIYTKFLKGLNLKGRHDNLDQYFCQNITVYISAIKACS